MSLRQGGWCTRRAPRRKRAARQKVRDEEDGASAAGCGATWDDGVRVLQRNLPACARNTVPVAARGRRATAPGSRSYVFFLPKLKLGLGSELGSGLIWNALNA